VNLTVRPAAPDDAAALAALMRDVYQEFGEEPPAEARVAEFFARRLAPGGGLEVLVALDEGQPCGLLTLAFAPTTLALASFAWLDDFHVAREHRRRGVGRLLLEAARELATQRGAVEIRLSSERGPELTRLYRESGFEPSALGLFLLRLQPTREAQP